MIGFPPESTNFPSAAVYSACSAVPRRSPCLTVTPPSASAWSSWRAPLADALAAEPVCAPAGVGAGVKNTSSVFDTIAPSCESAVTPPSRCAFPLSLQ